MRIIIIMTISGDIIRYDGVINIQYNGTSIIYTLSDGENNEIKMKCVDKFIVIYVLTHIKICDIHIYK